MKHVFIIAAQETQAIIVNNEIVIVKMSLLAIRVIETVIIDNIAVQVVKRIIIRKVSFS